MVITLPFIATSSTVNAVNVPSEVIFVCAAVVTVAAVPLTLPVTSPVMSPTNAVEVILVAPVTTPASILIVPSNRIAEPDAGSILIAAPESKVKTPAESISTVPSAVICMFAAAAASSVVTILSVPLVPTVNTAVSLLEPVIVMTLPFTATSSTVNAVNVPNEVIFVCAAVASVPAIVPPDTLIPALKTGI